MPKTRFKKNNQAALKHGGEPAIVAIKAGTEFTGPARLAEIEVYKELASEGRPAIVLRLAVRLTAASDLFHAAMIEAASRGDLEKMDRYVARFGWLAGASLRAWAQVAQEEKNSDDSGIIEALASAKGATNGNDSQPD